MKRIIAFIGVIALAATLNSCSRTHWFYAYCDSGHAHWEGPKQEYQSDGTHYDSARGDAESTGHAHDTSVHGGLLTAKIAQD